METNRLSDEYHLRAVTAEMNLREMTLRAHRFREQWEAAEKVIEDPVEHDRQVAERAWDEGYNAGHYGETEKHECDCPRANPYRKEQENTNA